MNHQDCNLSLRHITLVGLIINHFIQAINLSKFKILKFRNFAAKTDFLNYRLLSREFIKAFLISMIYLLAVPLRKEIYFEVYLKK